MIKSVPTETEETTDEETVTPGEWRTVSDPKQARWLFSQDLIHSHRFSKSLFMSMDIRQDREQQDQALVAFYRRDGIQWASAVDCKLKGDVAIGSGVERHMISTVIFRLLSGFHINLGCVAIIKIFEGEPDHLIPSVSKELLENNLFTVAGRMIGHSFLHGGPSFPGLSPAIIHILFDGTLETTPVTIRDCPDLDIREIIKMLDEDAELKGSDSIHQLCRSWNLPAPNATNKKWLAKKLLLHAVIEQTREQINQFGKGLRETGIWPLLTDRRDVIPILFPRESEAQITPQVLLDCIIWPTSITVIYTKYAVEEVEEDDESDVTDVCRICGYLKRFIENASPTDLKSLIKFWVGWEMPAIEMTVEIVEAKFPTASTCFEKLRLPRHYTAYKTFHEDLCACISTSYSGFGRV